MFGSFFNKDNDPCNSLTTRNESMLGGQNIGTTCWSQFMEHFGYDFGKWKNGTCCDSITMIYFNVN